MLLSINFQGLEQATFHGEGPAEPRLPAESGRAVGGFAELLGLSTVTNLSGQALQQNRFVDAVSGESLPDDGKDLPPGDLLAADWGMEWPAQPAMITPLPGTVAPGNRGDALAPAFRGETANPAVTAEPGEVSRAGPGQREPAVPVPTLPARPASDVAADVRQLQPVFDRSQRIEGRPATSPGIATAISGAISTEEIELALSAQDGEGPESATILARRLGLEPDGHARQPSSRDGLPPRPAFELQAASSGPSNPEPGAAPSSTANTESLLKASAPSAADNVVLRPGFTISQPSAASPAPAATLPRIDVPLQDPAWGDALNERVTFMSGKDIRNAEIRLNPAELGPIRVHLSVDDRGTSVSFTAHHAHTRDAIEQALPRLRELFNDQGLSLGQASVSDHGVHHGHERDGADRAEWLPQDVDSDDADLAPSPGQNRRVSDGLVDTFA